MAINSTTEQFFPYKQVRDSQDQLITDIQTTIKEQKILIAHAPTGLGKTVSVLSVALPKALEKKKTIFFLTNRHTQHQIAISTLKEIEEKSGKKISVADIIGKRWMCNQEIAGLFGTDFNEFCKSVVEKGECEFYENVYQKKKLTIPAEKLILELKDQGPLQNEELINLCRVEKMCSYEMVMNLAKKAEVIIGDYYYIFNPFVQKTFFKKLDLEMENVILVVDEGHNLPGRIAEMLTQHLTSNMIKNSIMEAKKFSYKGVINWLQELNKVLNQIATFPENERVREKLVGKETFLSKVKSFVDYDQFINELELAAEEIRKKQRKSYLGGVANFLIQWQGEDKGFTRIISERTSKYGLMTTLSYICLDAALVSKDIFEKVHSAIIMSGTLKPTFMYKDVLGISTEKGVQKEYASPFPLENKLNLIVPQTTTKYNLRGETMYRKIAEKCSEMNKLIPGNVALFFPSYHLRDQIAEFISSDKKLFWEKSDMNKEEKELFLESFKAEKEKGGVLLAVTGANFAEGIDFPGDLLNGVIVVGLPLAHPDLKTKEIIKYYEDKFARGWDYGYLYPAMNKCFQSAGRCIRSEKDKGAVIYLDERFTWQNYFCCFPREGLIVSNKYEQLLKEFF